MRPARYFPTAVLGMASLASQLAAPQPGFAWESLPASALSQSSDLQGTHYITDTSVQPAGYYDSRSRSNSASPAPSNSSAEVVSDDDSQSADSQRQGPMYRGQKLQMPNMPFGRQTSNKSTSGNSQSGNQVFHAPASPPASYLVPQRGPFGEPAPAQPKQKNQPGRVANSNQTQNYQPGRTANGNSIQNNQLNRVANNGPIQSTPQNLGPRLASLPIAALPVPATPSTRIPNASAVAPWQTKSPAPNASRIGVSTAAPAAGSSAADRLIAQAHELSDRAKTDSDYSQIVEVCRQAEASQPSPASAKYARTMMAWSLNRRGQLKAEAGNDPEAIADFSEAVEADPTCWRAIHNRGVLTAQAGEFEKAYDDFAKTIQLNPNFAKAYSNRAALFMIANNLKAARQDYDHAIQLDPNLAVAHRGDGRVCQLMGDVSGALSHYDASVKLAPTDAYAAACRADLLTDLGRYSEAATEYNRAIDIDPKSTQAQSGSAWLLATCPDKTVRKPDLAIQRAQTVIELGGDKDAVSLDTLAAAQANAGDFEAAMNSSRRAIELAAPQERDAYKQRFVMYQQAKPYRITPVNRVAQQVSYESTDGDMPEIK